MSDTNGSEAKVIDLPTTPTRVNGVVEPTNFRVEARVDELVRMHADPNQKDQDPSLILGRQVMADYGDSIRIAAEAVVDGVQSFDTAAAEYVRIYLEECERRLKLDGLGFKVNGVKNSDRMKRVMELILDGAGLLEVDGKSQSKTERNAARQAINRRANNTLELIKAGGHPKSALLTSWVRPGGNGTVDPDVVTFRFNFTNPDDCLEKLATISAKVYASWTDSSRTRSRAEKVIEKLEPVNANITLLSDDCNQVINESKAKDEAAPTAEAEAV